MSPYAPNWQADLWEELRKQGLSAEAATEEVKSRIAVAEHDTPDTPSDTSPPAPADGTSERLGGLARAVGQGATLGFGDEIEAGARTALGGGPYRDALKTVRDKQAAFKKQHPVINTVAEIAGGLAPAALTGGASMGTGQMIRAGMAYGGIAAAGGSDGTLQDRAGAAGLGALGGGVLGATVPLGARAIKGFADAFGTRSASGVAKRADELLMQSLQRDNASPGAIAAALKARQGAKPETIADLAGENTRGLARQAQATPGKAKEGLWTALEERAANQPQRIASDLETGIGLPRQDSGALIENLIQQRAKAAEPLYQKAYAHGAVNDQRINDLLQMPWFKEAYKRGARLAKAEGITLPKLYKTVMKPGAILDASGQPIERATQEVVGETPTVQMLDYVKRGMDDYLKVGMGKEGGLGPTERRAIANLKNEMLNRLDAAVPDYAAARAKYAGDSALRDAVEEGGSILRTDPMEVQRTMAGYTPAEKDMYRIGALDAVQKKMESTGDGRDLTKVIFGNDKVRNQLKHLFPTRQSFRVFEENMQRESEMATTRNVVGHGSPTARIQAEMADAGGMAPQALAQAATGNVGGAMMSGIAAALARRARGVTGEVADALNTSLQAGTKHPKDLEDLLQRLEGASSRQATKTMGKAVATKTVGAETGLTTGGEYARQLPKAAEIPSDQKKRPEESLDDYAMRLRRSGVPQQTARAYFAAQGF